MIGDIKDLLQSWDAKAQAGQVYGIAAELYPYCRSITGD